jgi:plasmid stability protein
MRGLSMAQVVIRNLEDEVKTRLKQRADQHGWGLEEEIRQILRHAAAEGVQAPVRLGSLVAARFAGVGLRSALPELHGRGLDPGAYRE